MKQPTTPITAKPIAQQRAIFINSFLSGFSHLFKNYIASFPQLLALPTTSEIASLALPLIVNVNLCQQNKINRLYYNYVHPMYSALIPVSYTHLTLPTICSVQISVVAVSLKKKKENQY
eukprot:TRINITY_DN2650_c0_g1_i5.p2 TRINITY_DN2650_c0_g1~~TRINITY_DN2650_c0_g1_i5.p2  ORF type:complete len:119 (-),score=17.23 TRINITY_DN2650_c0_g1_i5:113-469(-)